MADNRCCKLHFIFNQVGKFNRHSYKLYFEHYHYFDHVISYKFYSILHLFSDNSSITIHCLLHLLSLFCDLSFGRLNLLPNLLFIIPCFLFKLTFHFPVIFFFLFLCSTQKFVADVYCWDKSRSVLLYNPLSLRYPKPSGRVASVRHGGLKVRIEAVSGVLFVQRGNHPCVYTLFQI